MNATLYEMQGPDGPFRTEEGKRISRRLTDVHTWRGLFDPLASEWDWQPDLAFKWGVIEELKTFFNCKFDRVVWLYVEDTVRMEKYYRLSAVPDAVYQYAEHFPEAEVYLRQCRHPAFLEFCQWKGLQWREAVEVALSHDEKRVWSPESLSLLLLP